MSELLVLIVMLALVVIVAIDVHHLHGVIRMKFTELANKLNAASAQANKAKAEILAAVKKLQDEITDADVPQEVVDAANGVSTAVQALDDLNPDDPVPPVDTTPL